MKNGGGGGNWTRVLSKLTMNLYMLSPDSFFGGGIMTGRKSHNLVRMKKVSVHCARSPQIP